MEVAQRRESGVPPVLTQEEFTRLTDKIPENDILDDEDLALGTYECLVLYTLCSICMSYVLWSLYIHVLTTNHSVFHFCVCFFK